MPFRVKNITNYPVTIFNTSINPEKKLDLLTVESVANVKASIINGVLYDLLMGRSLSILNPYDDVPYLGLSDAEYSRLASAGFFKGLLGTEHLLHPLKFTGDGYLLTSATIGSITVESQSEVEGRVFDGASAAGIKPVIVSGVDQGGLSQSISVNTDGYLYIANTAAASYGPVQDGGPAYDFPVEMGGVDSSGNIQSLSVNTDGYLYIANTASASYGPVQDDTAAYGFPVEMGGVYRSDPTSNLLENGDIGSALLNEQRMFVVEDRAYDNPTDSNRIVPVVQTFDRTDPSTISGTASGNGSTYYYISMIGYTRWSLQWIRTLAATETIGLKIAYTNQDIDDIATATYTDVTDMLFATTSLTTSDWYRTELPDVLIAIRIEVVITNYASGSPAWTGYFNKTVG